MPVTLLRCRVTIYIYILLGWICPLPRCGYGCYVTLLPLRCVTRYVDLITLRCRTRCGCVTLPAHVAALRFTLFVGFCRIFAALPTLRCGYVDFALPRTLLGYYVTVTTLRCPCPVTFPYVTLIYVDWCHLRWSPLLRFVALPLLILRCLIAVTFTLDYVVVDWCPRYHHVALFTGYVTLRYGADLRCCSLHATFCHTRYVVDLDLRFTFC